MQTNSEIIKAAAEAIYYCVNVRFDLEWTLHCSYMKYDTAISMVPWNKQPKYVSQKGWNIYINESESFLLFPSLEDEINFSSSAIHQKVKRRQRGDGKTFRSMLLVNRCFMYMPKNGIVHGLHLAIFYISVLNNFAPKCSPIFLSSLGALCMCGITDDSMKHHKICNIPSRTRHIRRY